MLFLAHKQGCICCCVFCGRRTFELSIFATLDPTRPHRGTDHQGASGCPTAQPPSRPRRPRQPRRAAAVAVGGRWAATPQRPGQRQRVSPEPLGRGGGLPTGRGRPRPARPPPLWPGVLPTRPEPASRRQLSGRGRHWPSKLRKDSTGRLQLQGKVTSGAFVQNVAQPHEAFFFSYGRAVRESPKPDGWGPSHPPLPCFWGLISKSSFSAAGIFPCAVLLLGGVCQVLHFSFLLGWRRFYQPKIFKAFSGILGHFGQKF